MSTWVVILPRIPAARRHIDGSTCHHHSPIAAMCNDAGQWRQVCGAGAHLQPADPADQVQACWVIDGDRGDAEAFARAITQDVDPAFVVRASSPVAELLMARQAERDCRIGSAGGPHP